MKKSIAFLLCVFCVTCSVSTAHEEPEPRQEAFQVELYKFCTRVGASHYLEKKLNSAKAPITFKDYNEYISKYTQNFSNCDQYYEYGRLLAKKCLNEDISKLIFVGPQANCNPFRTVLLGEESVCSSPEAMYTEVNEFIVSFQLKYPGQVIAEPQELKN